MTPPTLLLAWLLGVGVLLVFVGLALFEWWLALWVLGKALRSWWLRRRGAES